MSNNQFDDYYGKYNKAAPLDSSDIMYPTSAATSTSSRVGVNGVKSSSSPRVGLSWPEEEHIGRRSLSPLTYSFGTTPGDRSFRVTDSSPSERRRLVSDLRMQARKIAMNSSPPMRLAQSSLARDSNGHYNEPSSIHSKRNFQSSMNEDRYRAAFDEAPSYERRRTTEEEAERELAELSRSTDSLRQLGANIMSSTNAFMGQVQADRQQYRGQLPPSSRQADASYQAQSSPQNGAAYAQPTSRSQQQRPTAYATMAAPNEPVQFMSHPQMYPQYQQAQIIGAPAGYPQVIFVQAPPSVAGSPAPPAMYPIIYTMQQQPLPIGSNNTAAAAPPFSPVMSVGGAMSPIPVAGSVVAPSPQAVAVQEPTVMDNAVERAAPISTSREAVAENTNTSSLVVPTGNTNSQQQTPSEAEVTKQQEGAAALVAAAATSESSTSALFEPSGQTKSDVVPPAHVDIGALEDERARRKREFLARRSQKESPEAQAMASMASQAAAAIQTKFTTDGGASNKPVRQVVIMEPPQSETTGVDKAPVPLPRPASMPMTPSPDPGVQMKSSINERSFSSVPEESATSLQDDRPDGSFDEERAARMARLAAEARGLSAQVDNKYAVVPFGVFLKTQGGSYDDADLQRSFKAVRPPPVIGKAVPLTGRRRARSTDDNMASSSTVSSPQSIITDPKLRQPIMLQGYLMKTSGPKRPTQIRGSWQRRYFILSGKLLLYTSSEASSQVKRMIDLNKVDVVTDSIPELEGAPTPHCIGLMEFGEPRMLTICASSHAEILEWYKGIVQNCALLCENKSPQKSLPPTNKTKVNERELWRKQMEQLQRGQLPMPPLPEMGWFYPIWRKPKSYYDVLGVPSDSTAGIIKKAYYRIAKDSHPDRSTRSMRNVDAASPLNKSASVVNPEEFANIALAYETLIDPVKRAEYDLAERVKEDLRNGIDCYHLECMWSDEDLKLEPRQRLIRSVVKRRVTVFCDGELRCLYWQPAPEPETPDGPAALLPLSPNVERSIEMRFVQQILYFRDGPIDFGKNDPPPYDNEARFVVMGDRLHTGPLLLLMKDHKQCTDLVHGLRVARCEKSMLFQQKLDSLKEAGIQ